MPAPERPIEPATGGVRVAVRVTPKASRAGIAGVGVDAAGCAFLKVRVTEAPEGGKANAAVVKLLAKAWGVPKGSIEVVSGQTGRRKILLVAGDAAALERALTAWLRTLEAGDGIG